MKIEKIMSGRKMLAAFIVAMFAMVCIAGAAAVYEENTEVSAAARLTNWASIIDDQATPGTASYSTADSDKSANVDSKTAAGTILVNQETAFTDNTITISPAAGYKLIGVEYTAGTSTGITVSVGELTNTGTIVITVSGVATSVVVNDAAFIVKVTHDGTFKTDATYTAAQLAEFTVDGVDLIGKATTDVFAFTGEGAKTVTIKANQGYLVSDVKYTVNGGAEADLPADNKIPAADVIPGNVIELTMTVSANGTYKAAAVYSDALSAFTVGGVSVLNDTTLKAFTTTDDKTVVATANTGYNLVSVTYSVNKGAPIDITTGLSIPSAAVIEGNEITVAVSYAAPISGDITVDTTLSANTQLSGDTTIKSGVTLTIPAKYTLDLNGNTLTVEGKLVVIDGFDEVVYSANTKLVPGIKNAGAAAKVVLVGTGSKAVDGTIEYTAKKLVQSGTTYNEEMYKNILTYTGGRSTQQLDVTFFYNVASLAKDLNYKAKTSMLLKIENNATAGQVTKGTITAEGNFGASAALNFGRDVVFNVERAEIGEETFGFFNMNTQNLSIDGSIYVNAPFYASTGTVTVDKVFAISAAGSLEDGKVSLGDYNAKFTAEESVKLKGTVSFTAATGPLVGEVVFGGVENNYVEAATPLTIVAVEKDQVAYEADDKNPLYYDNVQVTGSFSAYDDSGNYGYTTVDINGDNVIIPEDMNIGGYVTLSVYTSGLAGHAFLTGLTIVDGKTVTLAKDSGSNLSVFVFGANADVIIDGSLIVKGQVNAATANNLKVSGFFESPVAITGTTSFNATMYSIKTGSITTYYYTNFADAIIAAPSAGNDVALMGNTEVSEGLVDVGAGITVTDNNFNLAITKDAALTVSDNADFDAARIASQADFSVSDSKTYCGVYYALDNAPAGSTITVNSDVTIDKTGYSLKKDVKMDLDNVLTIGKAGDAKIIFTVEGYVNAVDDILFVANGNLILNNGGHIETTKNVGTSATLGAITANDGFIEVKKATGAILADEINGVLYDNATYAYLADTDVASKANMNVTISGKVNAKSDMTIAEGYTITLGVNGNAATFTGNLTINNTQAPGLIFAVDESKVIGNVTLVPKAAILVGDAASVAAVNANITGDVVLGDDIITMNGAKFNVAAGSTQTIIRAASTTADFQGLEIAGTLADGTMATNGDVTVLTGTVLTVQRNATLSFETGVLKLAGTGTVDLNGGATATLALGKGASTLGADTPIAVDGTLTLTAGRLITYLNIDLSKQTTAFPVTKTVFNIVKGVSNFEYMTQYAVGGDVNAKLLIPAVQGLSFQGWYLAPVGGNALEKLSIGDADVVYGQTTSEKFNVTLNYVEGVTYVIGQATYVSGSYDLPANTPMSISVEIASGYTGTPTITGSGAAQVSNGSITLTGNGGVVNVTGVQKAAEGGMSITEILMIVLVVVVVVLAIVIVMRLMRS